MLGIDLYDRYQDVTDWSAVRRAGVTFVYIKGSDGSQRAVVPADAFVRGAKSVGLPAGLYHFAQLSPTPEAQADVLAAEVRRLGATGLPPALDLEGPHPLTSASRDFAIRFLRRLRGHYPWVTLYASTSMLKAIGASSLGVPDVLIWAANYGPNDGIRHADRLTTAYPGRVDIHQYTSVGGVSGVTGGVDLNESLTDYWPGSTTVLAQDVWDYPLPERCTPEAPAGASWAAWSWLRNMIPNLLGANVETKVAAEPSMPLRDLLALVHVELRQQLSLDGRPGPDRDTLLGHVLSMRAELRQARNALLAASGQPGTLHISEQDKADLVKQIVTAQNEVDARAIIDEMWRRLTPSSP